MTRTALKKIIFCAIGLILGIACCIALDISIDASSPRNAQGSEAMEGARELDTTSLMELLEDKNTTTLDLAERCFDRSFETTLPQAFANEALDPRAFDEAYRSGDLISLTYNGSIDEARAFCNEKLEEKDWNSLGVSNSVLTSFAKAHGTYRCLTLQYLSVGSKTVVVVRTA